MKQPAILIAAILFLFISCKKDVDVLPDSSDYIVAGIDYSNVSVTPYGTVFQGDYYHPVFVDIDMNNDGIKDIRLLSERYGSPGTGIHPRAEISCLNQDCFLSVFLFTETIYKNDTTWV